MIETHFTSQDLTFLIAGIILIVASCIMFSRGKINLAIAILMLGGFTLRLMMAYIDPFVNIWDEQYHALVAKNLASDFFHPKLVVGALEKPDPAYWAYTETWLHKPPLFLWQMALSIKAFGATPWAIRIPSVILSTLMIPAIFRCGKILANERVGFYAALLMACANIQINIVSGWLNTDQNDAVFAAYVFFSFWTWMEYVHSKKMKWLFFTACFCAAAVLTKWLPGLLVLGAATFTQIIFYDNRHSKKGWVHLLILYVTTFALAAPWFVYAASQWPEEWAATFAHYNAHTQSDFAHPGPWWYHFDQVKEQWGWWFIVLTGISLPLFLNGKTNGQIKAGILVAIVAMFSFFIFVPIKMPFFCFPVTPLLVLIAAFGLENLLSRVHNYQRAAVSVTCIVIAMFSLNVGRLEHYHTDRDPKEFYRKTRINNRACFEHAAIGLPPNTVIFNCGEWNAVPCMFYTGFTAYDHYPSEEQLRIAKEQNRPVAVFVEDGIDENIFDPEIILLHEPLIRNGF